jgi:hypothetical protein
VIVYAHKEVEVITGEHQERLKDLGFVIPKHWKIVPRETGGEASCTTDPNLLARPLQVKTQGQTRHAGKSAKDLARAAGEGPG